MQDIKSFCWSLIIVSLCVGICLLVAPEDKPSLKYLRFLGALCITSIIVLPIKNALSGNFMRFEIPEYSAADQDASEYRNMVIAETKDRLEKEARSSIAEEYGVACAGCEAVIEDTETGEIRLTELRAAVDTKSDFLIAEIKKRLSEKFGCEILIVKSGKG